MTPFSFEFEIIIIGSKTFAPASNKVKVLSEIMLLVELYPEIVVFAFPNVESLMKAETNTNPRQIMSKPGFCSILEQSLCKEHFSSILSSYYDSPALFYIPSITIGFIVFGNVLRI